MMFFAHKSFLAFAIWPCLLREIIREIPFITSMSGDWERQHSDYSRMERLLKSYVVEL